MMGSETIYWSGKAEKWSNSGAVMTIFGEAWAE